jgi:glycosyltransferase involved in cell wall biosynthesis
MRVDQGKVSIVVTCYNYGKYISDCLNSILKQKYQNYEVVIIDDGSTDNTEKVVSPYLENQKIKYCKQENMGQAGAKNNGIRNSTGEFIAFLDADDMWADNMLEKEMALFSDKRIGVVYSRVRFINEKNKEVIIKSNNKYLLPRSGNITSYLLFENIVTFSSSIVRKECLDKCGYFDESFKMGIDWDLWLRISTKYQFSYVNEPLLIYRIHSTQMSKNHEERRKCSDGIMNKFFQQNPNLISKKTARKSWAYTYNNRGNSYHNSDFRQSVVFHLRSIREWPWQFAAYKDLVMHILRQVVRRGFKL